MVEQKLEGGLDDVWFHDDVDSEIDAAWQKTMDKRSAAKRLGNVIATIKHLPGHHDQETHAGDDFQMGPDKDGGSGDKGSFNPPTNALQVPYGSTITHGPHAFRKIIGEKKVKYKLKNGETREKTVTEYEYYDGVTGKKITDKKEIEYLNSVKVRPAAHNVIISRDQKAHHLAAYQDDKGRRQPVYSKAHDKAGAANKFERLKRFNKALRKIRRQMNIDINDPNSPDHEAAVILYLIDKTGFRAGTLVGDTGADKQAYGAATLLNKHVKINGNKVTFDFVGKKGVDIHLTVNDAKLAELLAERKTSKWSQPIFSTSAGRALKYLDKIAGEKGFKVHDFRTWHATDLAWKLVKKRKGPASSEAKFKQWQKEVAIKVSKKLANTPGMVLNAYIDPHVWTNWRKPQWGQWLPKVMKGDD